MNLKTPIILALDVDDFAEGLELARRLKFGLGAIKIGPRLMVQRGAEVIAACSELAPVFVDNKYHDIPNTMESAVRTTFEAGATLTTVHALAGEESLKRLAKLEAELNKKRPFKILAVTVLTSHSDQTLPFGLKDQQISDLVSGLAKDVLTAGLSGLVCSPLEVAALRAASPSAFLVTPGIRFEAGSADDQKRTLGPKEALDKGANALVIGRPLLAAQDPVAELRKILDLIGVRS